MPIDTHQTYKELLEAGVPEPQADAHARIFQSWTEERLVTREYLDLRLKEQTRELKDDYTRMAQDIRSDFTKITQEIRNDLTAATQGLKDDHARVAREQRDEYTELHRSLREELREQGRRQMNWMLGVVGVATAIISGLITVFGIFG